MSSVVSESNRNTKTKNNERMTLTSLPSELLLIIADHLPPTDRGCRALGNHRLLDVLFKPRNELKQCFRIVAPDDPLFVDMGENRIDSLKRLSRDLPSH